MKYRLCLNTMAALLGYTTPTQAQWLANANAGYEFNDNLSNAQLAGDINNDSVFHAKVSAGKYFQLTDATGLTLTADVGGANYLRFNGLNNVSYGGSTALRHKFGLGESVPWASICGSVAYLDFENTPRDGVRYNLAVTLGKRLDERWELLVKYRYDEHIADHIYNIPGLTQASFGDDHPPTPIAGDAFNIAAHSVSLTALFTVTHKLTAYLSYTRREGGITSTIARDPEVLEYANAIAIDSAFGNGRFAYRTNASTNLFSIGLSWALTGHASLSLGYQRLDTYADHGLGYTNNIGHLNLLYNF